MGNEKDRVNENEIQLEKEEVKRSLEEKILKLGNNDNEEEDYDPEKASNS